MSISFRADPKHLVFLTAFLVCLLPVITPPIALAMGLVVAFTTGHPYLKQNGKFTKLLLQWSVVGLGFGMNLHQVLSAGKDGFLFTVVTIFGTLLLGYALGRALKLDAKISHLVSSGTAICGGSAIAAVAPVLEASAQEMSVALGTVFVLNSVALFIFPWIGNALGLTQHQFGIWSAIAIHDTSSVVGAAAKFGAEALQIATTVKLSRALWIVPLTLLTSFLFKRKSSKLAVPLFIVFFVCASVVRTYLPAFESGYSLLVLAAKIGLKLTLFLIGAGLSREALRSVGVRPLVHGVTLWVAISCTTLWAVLHLL